MSATYEISLCKLISGNALDSQAEPVAHGSTSWVLTNEAGSVSFADFIY